MGLVGKKLTRVRYKSMLASEVDIFEVNIGGLGTKEVNIE